MKTVADCSVSLNSHQCLDFRCLPGSHNDCCFWFFHTLPLGPFSLSPPCLIPSQMQAHLLLGPVSELLPSKNTRVSSHFFLQGIFLTQGSNPGLLHCRQVLYRLSYEGSPEPTWNPSTAPHPSSRRGALAGARTSVLNGTHLPECPSHLKSVLKQPL